MKTRHSGKIQRDIMVLPAVRLTLIGTVFALAYLFFSTQIVFVNADLGRHLKNGELFFATFTPLATNFYSYTTPEFKVINHHWGSGVVLYLVQRAFGFQGLSVFFALISAATVLLVFLVAERKSHTYIAFAVCLICLPLIADRKEIRPEMFSMLLLCVYCLLLEVHRAEKLKTRSLACIIVALQIIWVNLHILFALGLVLVGIYALAAIVEKQANAIRNSSYLLTAALLACFINPFGFRGVLAPLSIFKNYGYRIVENQSVLFMQSRGIYPQAAYFEVLMLGVVVILAYVAYRTRTWKALMPETGIGAFFGCLGFSAIRGIPIMCLLAVPVAAHLLHTAIAVGRPENRPRILRLFLIAGCGIALFFVLGADEKSWSNYLSPLGERRGFHGGGLIEEIQHSAEFFRHERLSGPIFNNYDIGGYLIFHLFPQEKVFVDNRPEAYPSEFLRNVYNAMLEKEDIWAREDATYKFNCIYFFRLDETPHGQPFLIRRLRDRKNWAPVYVDDVAIIFLRRSEKNVPVIQEYEIPETFFSAVPNPG